MKRQGFLKSSAILVAMTAVTKAMGLIYKIPLANILGGTGMGHFSAAFSVFTPVLALGVSGICPAMAKLSAENSALGRFTDLRRRRKTALAVFTITGLLLCAAVIGAAYFTDDKSCVRPAIICLAPSVVFCGVMNAERGYYEGLGNVLPTAFSEIAETLFRLILGLGLAVYIKDYAEQSYIHNSTVFGMVCNDAVQAEQTALPYIAAGAVLGSTIASAIACIGLILYTAIHGDGITSAMLSADKVISGRRQHAEELLRLSFPIAAAAVVTTLTGMLDMLTLPPFLKTAISRSPQHYSEYISAAKGELPNFLYGSYEGLAVMLYGLVPTVTAMLGKSVIPSLSAAVVEKDSSALIRNMRRLLTLTASAAIPCGLGITVMSGEILGLLFSGRGAECTAAQEPLMILGISVIGCAVTLPLLTVIQALGKPSEVTLIMLAGAGIKLCMNIILVPLFGLNGAALSELIRSISVCTVTLIMISELIPGRIGIAKLCIKPFYAGIMCAVSAKLFCDTAKKLQLNEKCCAVLGIAGGGIICITVMALLFEEKLSEIFDINYFKTEKNRC